MRRSLTLLTWLSLLALSHSSFAVARKEESGRLDRLAFSDPSLRSTALVEPVEPAGAALSPGVAAAWGAFLLVWERSPVCG